MSDDGKAAPSEPRGARSRCRELVERAADWVKTGEPDRAIAALSEARELHRRAGRAVEASHCACQAATIARLGGALERAVELATAAQELAGDHDASLRAASLELAEVALLADRPAEAAGHLLAARDRSTAAPLELRAALAMKHAEALALAGRAEDAEQAWDSAARVTSGQSAEADVLVRRATVLCHVGSSAAPGAIARAKAVAVRWDNRRALADLALLECSQALRSGELDVALRAAENARSSALASGAVMVYVSAAAMLSRLHAVRGDRASAYRSLAVGWTTLSDRLGRELARASFAPLLAELRAEWGDEAFASVKEQVERGG